MHPTHLLLIPSFDTGPILVSTVREACRHWPAVWIVVDGSTDGSDILLERAMAGQPGLRILRLPRNGGKGAAVLAGAEAALAEGYTHALTMDADGQHPAASIEAFMAASMRAPDALVLGAPVFGPDAPWIRRTGRRLCDALVRLELGDGRVKDSLFGFRVYPIAPLLAVMRGGRGMRGFDFDPEAAVRLCWRGLPTINLPAPVRYPERARGGVSHFRYRRDNWKLARMHARLLTEAGLRAWRARRPAW